MSLLVLYLLLLKASVTSFSGMTSLPVVRRDFTLNANDFERIIAEVRYLDGLYSLLLLCSE